MRTGCRATGCKGSKAVGRKREAWRRCDIAMQQSRRQMHVPSDPGPGRPSVRAEGGVWAKVEGRGRKHVSGDWRHRLDWDERHGRGRVQVGQSQAGIEEAMQPVGMNKCSALSGRIFCGTLFRPA